MVSKNAENMDVKLENISEQTAQLALQGPVAEKVLQKITDIDLTNCKNYC